MRQPQQKNRMRGRGRKPSNPLSRNFESNGPDVKIRGNASHIAEKYSTLARDASSSGDPVMAENYFQHAEHYNRIVAAANSNANSNQGNNPGNNANRNEDQSNNGRGPQPDLNARDNSGDAENAQRAEREDHAQPNGSRSAKQEGTSEESAVIGDAGADKPRREQRPRRRPRKVEVASDTDKVNGHDEAGGEDSSPKEPSNKEITSDAAKLPGNLLGVAADDPETSAAKDD